MSDYWADVITNWSSVLTFVRRRGVPDCDVEDVAANGLYKCWHAIHFNDRTFATPRQFWSYFWISVRSAAGEYHREREVPRTDIDDRTASIVDGVPEPLDLPAQVVEVIAVLPPEQRIALAAILDGTPQRELDGLHGLSTYDWHNVTRNVRGRLRRAYAQEGVML